MWKGFKRLRRRWHPWRFAKRRLVGLLQATLKLVVVLAIVGLGSVTFIHLTNGFTLRTSLGAGFQDVRLLVTCPRDGSLQWQFIDRSQIEQVGLGVAINMGEHVYTDVCSAGSLPSVRLAERGQKLIDARLDGFVKSQEEIDARVRRAATPSQPANGRATLLPASEPTPPLVLPSPPKSISTRVPLLLPTPVPTQQASLPALSPSAMPTASTLPDLKRYLLGLINLDRAANGLSPVKLGDNPAAQQHAEEMLEHSYLSHWGLDGMKPYMRYTLAGGVNYEAENNSGVSSAPVQGLRYRTISPQDEVKEAEEGLMDSTGHRANILKPWHKRVNLGIACNRITCAVVQQFEGDYIAFDELPTISGGVFSVAGRLSGGVEFDKIDIWYDPPPHLLTLGQLDTTYCYTLGETLVAMLRAPLPPGMSYVPDNDPFTWHGCSSPYDVSPDTPRRTPFLAVPQSPSIGLLLQVPWVTAGSWQVSGGKFQVQADLTGVMKGPGVYTILVWGTADGHRVELTTYAIFVEDN